MDWTQTLTIMATMLGAVFAFYKLTRDEIQKMDDNMQKLDATHREDMQRMDNNHREDMKHMDVKWAHLFEHFVTLLQKKS